MHAHTGPLTNPKYHQYGQYGQYGQYDQDDQNYHNRLTGLKQQIREYALRPTLRESHTRHCKYLFIPDPEGFMDDYRKVNIPSVWLDNIRNRRNGIASFTSGRYTLTLNKNSISLTEWKCSRVKNWGDICYSRNSNSFYFRPAKPRTRAPKPPIYGQPQEFCNSGRLNGRRHICRVAAPTCPQSAKYYHNTSST